MAEIPNEDLIALGMRTAGVVVERQHGTHFAECVFAYEKDWLGRIKARKSGCREMVADDIFLSMPVMHPGDLGIASTSTGDSHE